MTDEENKADAEKQPKTSGQRKGKSRRKGSGSVFRRPERKGGKEWVAQIILEDGTPRQRYFKTQAEADEARNEMLYEQRHGTLITEKDQTVKRQLEHWIENVHKNAIRPSTYAEYRRTIDKHIIPELGHLKLQQLTVNRVEAFYTRKAEDGLSASSLKQIHKVLRQALDHAVRSNLLSRNVCDIAKKALPRQTRYEIKPLTQEQAQALVSAARGRHLEALFILAIMTGMRKGELLALRWSDIDLDNGYLQVHHTLRRVSTRGYTGSGPKTKLTESEPKTTSSRRKIVLPPFLVDVLKKHRIRQLEERLQAGNAWVENNLVFCNPHGTFREPSAVYKTFQRFLKDAGLPTMRFHDLRHSAATLLLTMGVHVKVVQELLGHSSITMTLNTYSHVLPSLQKDAMDKMSDLFNQQRSRDDGQGGCDSS